MFDLKKLKDEMGEKLQEMENTQKLLEEYEGKEDKADELKDLAKVYEEQKADFEKLEGKAAEAEAFSKRKALKDKIAAMSETDPAKSLDAKPPAEPNDYVAQENEHMKALYNYILGKSISDNQRDLLRPRSKGFSGEASNGVSLPARMCKAILGITPIGYYGKAELPPLLGKANPMTSVQAAYANLVPQDYRAELLQLAAEPSWIYPRARKTNCPTGQVTYPRLVQTDANEFGGVSVTWIDEAAEKPYTEPIFDQLKISAHELAARTEIGTTLLSRSAIDLEAFMNIEFRMAIMNAVDVAFLTGSGTGQPLGIFNDTIRTVARITAGQVNYDDLVNMEHQILAHHRANAIWVMGDDVMQSLKLKKDNDGRPLFVPNPGTGAYDTLLGYPYVTTHRLSLGSDDIVFGDWSQYIVPVEQEIVLKMSEHRRIERNVNVYVAFMLIGGRAAHSRAFVKLDAATS